ncbi:chondroitinase-B domain-containing protein [Lewinella cohaerens]|uniref:chondroitinase-B domain-containing protein n=1 Tax=Lewinella cohaerens TaxID=70995 RepID=UPI00037A001A|nr:chondroitinase-B domain-containing protein [Lewinella cohaerens]
MKLPLLFSFLFVSVLVSAQNRYDVSSQSEFNTAQDLANAGDTIAWVQGTYSDTRMDIDKDGLIVTAIPYGTVLFTGVSRVVINGDDVTFSGFQYIGGFVPTLDVIRVYGSDVLITQVNIQNYTSFKYLRVYEESRRTTISYCNFENRLNLDDQNILSILVDDEPGYHKIQYCSFKNFDGIGNDQGIEPIRIGVSSQWDLDSRTLVEYCYFTQCNGDGEIISHKSRQNVYRYNTFENNPVAELVLRHGDEGIVYGNFFLNNMGGIRIREGSNHFIYNNYFEGQDRRTIYLQNDPSDPLSDIHIYHNTIIDSEEFRLGGNGNNPPTNVIIANNVFTDPKTQLFDEDTGNETWIGNLSFGTLGIDSPSSGLSNTDPELVENIEGFFQPASNSPVIAAASAGYPVVPLYPGMDYDNEILFDLMIEPRPVSIADRAIGASEFSSTVNVQPHATEMNTGPSYLFDNLVNYIAANVSQLYIGGEGENRSIVISSNIDWTITSSTSWISTNLSSGSGDAQLTVTIDANEENVNRSGTLTITGGTQSVTINVFQDPGGPVGVQENLKSEVLLFPNPTDGSVRLSNLPSGIYSSHLELVDLAGRSLFSKEYRIDNNELLVDLDKLVPGTYILNIKFMLQNGTIYRELTRRVVRN